MSRRRIPVLAAAALALFALSCGDSNGPPAEHEVKIQSQRFFPNSLDITPGARVRWVNTQRAGTATDRTVTAVEGPDERWEDVDVVLAGAPSGEPVGEEFIFKFEMRGTYTYRSRLPEGEEFTGTVRVQ